jgi:hypothetical protein
VSVKVKLGSKSEFEKINAELDKKIADVGQALN